MKLAITLLALLVVSSGYFINESFAEISENQAFLLEGSGFAVTEESIKISEINLGLASQQQSGSSINFVAENGFITLDEEEFLISNLEGKFLREGRYIRINGDVESSSGFDTSISFFGRLVEESKDAAVYGFTGRITTSDDTYKIIYTTKLSSLTQIEPTTTSSEESNDIIIHILYGASTREGGTTSYTTSGSPLLRYFSQTDFTIDPSTTITIVNDDVVTHNVLSGLEHRSRDNPFSPDGRISSGDIAPGESVSITLDDVGFYKLYDPDYTWMKITIFVKPLTNSVTFGEGKNSGN